MILQAPRLWRVRFRRVSRTTLLAILMIACFATAYGQTTLDVGIPVSNSDSLNHFVIDPGALPAVWSVIGLRSPAGVDYDLPLFSDTAGTVQVTASTQNDAEVDFDVINFHAATLAPYYPAAVSRGGTGPYWMEWSHAQDTIPAGNYSVEFTWNSNEVVQVFEFRASQAGLQPLTLLRTSGTGDFGMGIYALSTAPYATNRAAALATGTLNGDVATLNFTADTSTWYGIVVWSRNGGASTFRIGNQSAPAIVVTAPNGGENWASASTHAITWTSAGLTGRVALQLNRDYPTGTWETVGDTTASLGTYLWTVTNPGTLTGRLRIVSDLYPFIGDTSNANFTVSGVTVLSPAGGENWTVGSTHNITWAAVGFTGTVNVSINRTYPSGSWTSLFSGTPNDSIQSWTVSSPTSTAARIRVRSSANTSISAVSDANFTVSPTPALTLTSPNGGETWQIGSAFDIRWTQLNVSGQVKLDLNRNYPSGVWETIADSTANDNVYSWLVTGPETAIVRLRIRSVNDSTIGDTSNAVFAIASVVPPSITVTAPNGGESWMVGSAHAITWTSFAVPTGVRVQLNRGYPSGTWETIADSVANSGTYMWTVTDTASALCRMRILSTADSTLGDTSNANFVITALQTITVTSPNGGETWYTGTSQAITWTSVNIPGNVSIEINRTYPTGNWISVINSTANTGSYTWTVTAFTSTAARIRVRSVTTTSLGDSSNANFSITLPPDITVHAPNGGEDWMIGTVHNITWARSLAPGSVAIELMRDYPAGSWEVVVDSTAADTSYAWTVTGPEAPNARIRIRTLADPSYTDTSNADFSIIPFQSISLLSPNGGESWINGTSHNITWLATGFTSAVQIQIKTAYPSGNWATLAATAPNTGSYLWTINQGTASSVRIRIREASLTTVSDTSNANFAIIAPTVTVTAPNGGEVLAVDSAAFIRWSSEGVTGAMTVDFCRDYPWTTWEVLADSVANSGEYAWVVTGAPTVNARIRVRWRSNLAVGDTSDAAVIISSTAPTALRLSAPNGGETWEIGTVQAITWTAWSIAGRVRVQLDRAYPSGTWETLTDSAATAGPWVWTVTGPATTSARVRLVSVADTTRGDTSNFNFTVAVPLVITVTAPNGGETWWSGSTHAITWTSANITGNVAIDLNRSYPGTTWTTLAGNVANSGSFDWTVTGALSSTARVRVRSLNFPAVADTSNADFSLVSPPSLILNAPNGGELWYLGTTYGISWTAISIFDRLAIELNRNYPAGAWELLADTTAAPATFNWLATGTASSTVRIRVRSLGATSSADTSDADFALRVRPVLHLTAPNGGETLTAGTMDTVRWTASDLPGSVDVYLNRNYPTGSWGLIGSVAAPTAELAMPVAGPTSTHVRIKVVAAEDASVFDISDADFTILQPSLALVHPNGGEMLGYQQPDTIRWTRTAAEGNVLIEWDPAYPSSWQVLGVSDVDEYVWSPGTPSEGARVRISLVSIAAIADSSDSNFVVIASSVSAAFSGIPTRYSLAAIYPNPFNPATRIVIGVPVTSRVNVRIFDILGREVASLYDGDLTAGYQTLLWNADGFASGTYIVSFETRDYVARQTIRYVR